MWMNSVMYLEDKKGFNFTEVLEKNLYKERSYCMNPENKDPPYECGISAVCPI
jgi:hypothetical protein